VGTFLRHSVESKMMGKAIWDRAIWGRKRMELLHNIMERRDHFKDESFQAFDWTGTNN